MYRLISLLLVLVALAILFFSATLCNDGSERCEHARSSRMEGLASHPSKVQRMMVVLGILAFTGGVIGFLRGPRAAPPSADYVPPGHPITPHDLATVPFLVRGATLLGAIFALMGALLPVLVFVAPIARGLGIPFVAAIVLAVALVGYFGWYLRGD
ncbi:MAG TPA: hypothetical protein VF678_05920 [bacterium]